MTPNTPWYHTAELAKNLYGIGEPNHFEEVNSFLLIGTKTSVLIDTGMGFFSMKNEIEKITKTPIQVLNTHSHFDHVGCNYEFKNILMYDHQDNKNAAENGFSNDYLAQWASPEQFTESSKNMMQNITPKYHIPPFPHAKYFTEGEIIHDTTFTLTAIHTPGHSDDSVCFFEQNKGWLFSGDLLYDGPIYIEKQNGLKKFKQSLTKIKNLKPLNRIFSSHNFFEFSLEKLDKLSNVVSEISTEELEEEVKIDGRLRLVPE